MMGLMQGGVDVHTSDHMGRTACHLAAAMGHLSTVITLIDSSQNSYRLWATQFTAGPFRASHRFESEYPAACGVISVRAILAPSRASAASLPSRTRSLSRSWWRHQSATRGVISRPRDSACIGANASASRRVASP